LARGELHCIGATLGRMPQYIEEDAALERPSRGARQQPSVEAIAILRWCGAHELHHGVESPTRRLSRSRTLHRYITDHFAPTRRSA
jgi:ATP-dependent Clp protease ATP-binding subunit ClpA